MSRRTFLRAGFAAPFALAAAGQGTLAAAEAPKAKSILLVWLGGGPSHLDLFDPKPKAPAEYRGPFATIATRTPGRSIHRAAAQAGGPIAQVFVDPKQRQLQRRPSRGGLDRLDRRERGDRRSTRPTSARSWLASEGMTRCRRSSRWPAGRSATASGPFRAPAAGPGAGAMIPS